VVVGTLVPPVVTGGGTDLTTMVAMVSEEQSERRDLPIGLVAIGLVVGLAVGMVVAVAMAPDSGPGLIGAVGPPSTVAPETPEAAEAFLVAWERSRRATYLTVSEWHRVTESGGQLREVRVFAQRRPDRVRSTGRNTTGDVGGLARTCDEGEDGAVTCFETESGTTVEQFDTDVDREVELMWRHVEGTSPLYRVAQDGECFHFRIDRPMFDPPYGQRTMWCFDSDTGAVREFRIERVGAIDTERALWVTGTVTDADLTAIIQGEYEPRVPDDPADNTGGDGDR
jgi:hypothetical protein